VLILVIVGGVWSIIGGILKIPDAPDRRPRYSMVHVMPWRVPDATAVRLQPGGAAGLPGPRG